MNFDIGEVLSSAWQITWKHTALWIIGILYGFVISMMFFLMLIPALFPVLVRESRMNLMIAILVALIAVFLLVMLAIYPIGSVVQTSLTLGVLDAQRAMERSSVSDLIKRSLPFFWRVLGIMVLYAVGMMLVVFTIQALAVVLSVLTLGLATMCLAPLSILFYPVLYAAVVWMELAINSIVIDDLPFMDAVRKGWDVLRNNLLSIALVALIVYFGVGMITGVVMLPMMFPAFLLPIGLIEQEVNGIILAISVASLLIFIPVFAVLSGWAMIFSKSSWVLTYLRLTHGSGSQPVLQQATT